MYNLERVCVGMGGPIHTQITTYVHVHMYTCIYSHPHTYTNTQNHHNHKSKQTMNANMYKCHRPARPMCRPRQYLSNIYVYLYKCIHIYTHTLHTKHNFSFFEFKH